MGGVWAVMEDDAQRVLLCDCLLDPVQVGEGRQGMRGDAFLFLFQSTLVNVRCRGVTV